MNRQRVVLLFTLSLAAAALVLLGAGLRDLELQPGRALTVPEMEEPRGLPLPQFPAWQVDPGPLPPGIAVVIIGMLAVSLLMFILSADFRRQVIKRLRWLFGLATILLIYIYGKNRPQIEAIVDNAGPPVSGGGLPTTPFTAAPSYWLSFWVTFGLVLVTGGLAWWFWKRRQSSPDLMSLLGKQAQQALDELKAGHQYQNVVIQCYAEMVHLVEKNEGVEPEVTMTAREFERRLVGLGLPAEAVYELTRLFENTRYGSQEPDQIQQDRAIKCLSMIAETTSWAKYSPEEDPV